MNSTAVAYNETDRLAELDKLEVMYTKPEEVFDRVTAQLSAIFDSPVVMMNLIDKDNQYIKSSAGIPESALGNRVIPRQYSICNHVVVTNQSLVVEDLAADERFRDNALIKAHGLRFYAGAPLHSDTGQSVGTLCVMDFKPRQMTVREQQLLKMLADSLMTELKLRKASRQLLDRTREMERDLRAARSVQRFLLPPPMQVGEGFCLRHYYHPFDAIGGDFLDARLRPDGSMAALLADVSGHGASAALTSVMVKTSFERAALVASAPGEILTSICSDLGNAGDNGQFITAAASMFDPAKRQVQLASAGHPFPILLRGGIARVIDTVNELPLLIDPAQIYAGQTVLAMEAGDRLIHFTDGATEAADPSGVMLDVEGLLRLIEANARVSGSEFLPILYKNIRGHAVEGLRDDVALVCLEIE